MAVHLTVAADLAGTAALVIDLDPQTSAAPWRDLRKAEDPAVEWCNRRKRVAGIPTMAQQARPT